MLELKPDTIIVSDVHYSKINTSFIKDILETKASQIVLNGDIFELISDYISESKKYNIDLIEALNSLAQKKEILYLEGNHDFNLKKTFKNIKIIDIKNQPLKCKYNNKVIYIAHGDCFAHTLRYKIYTMIIRNKLLLKTIDLLEKIIGNKVFYKIIDKKSTKNKCKKIQDFREIVKKRISKYPKDADFIIEGHFHQGVRYIFDDLKYINLPAYYCDKQIYKINTLTDGEDNDL